MEKYRNQLVAEGESIRLLATDDLRVIFLKSNSLIDA